MCVTHIITLKFFTFARFANSNAPSFGNLAQQTNPPSFGSAMQQQQQQQQAPAFGGGGGGNAFGSPGN